MTSGRAVLVEDVLIHVDRALRGMCATLTDLGDELANVRPALPGANSAYAILTHCLGVMEFWGGQVLAGREIVRDRAAELVASGPVAELVARVPAGRDRLLADLVAYDGAAPPTGPLEDRDRDDLPEFTRTQGGVLMHIYEELAQHRGHVDLTADLVRHASGVRL
ncbi:DinB family protein [Luteipulveratus flavus]|uniref:DinB family protein n=1 Tax=Luteipulveratus flavus TaxID=3031728 RepID=A0ABT6CAP1_9MICO|nr:DinB family protein [Luteipulveratus sp. YIM 133296]MDF8265442.1 DinB family protein [Luteipulveratus sp. YIM 133296]